MNSSHILLHLSLIENIGPSLIQRLITSLGSDNLHQLYAMNIADCMRHFGLSEPTAQKLVNGLGHTILLEKELLLIEQNKIPWITLLDPAYPELLKNIHLPPPILYWLGTLPADSNTIAIVGSRDAHEYGQQAIDQLVPPLVANGWLIVSGGARGADTMAHQATLDVGGKTIAVLGSGLLNWYPPENKQLFQAIVQSGGALISPFPLLMEPLPQNFPARNRVIAGLSRGCIVVQAAAKSGARITADFCLSQGREVFAIPGPIDDLLSAGCHALIQQGAKLTTKIEDILIEFGQEIIASEKQLSIASATFKPAIRALENSEPGPEGVILRACAKPCSVDELLEMTGLPLIQMTQMLFDLQLKGRITQNMAGLWEKQ